MTHNPHSSHSFHRSQSADLTQPQPSVLLAAHSSNTLPSMSVSGSFHRTVESARHLRDSFTSVIRGIDPLVETAQTVNAEVSSFLNRPESESDLNTPPVNDDGSYVINFHVPTAARESDVDEEIEIEDGNFLNNPTNNTDDNNSEDQESTQTVIEAQEYLKVLLKYVPFILILLAKAVYDYYEGIFILIILFGIFVHSNLVVKEAIKRQRRSILTLCFQVVYIFVCLVLIHYEFEDDLHNFDIVLNLVLIRTFTHPFSVWSLLWIVLITDFVLKLFTVTIKILVTMLPGALLELKKRGKVYLFIEAVSQLYRSIAAIQPWLYYLLESYQGPEKIVAVFLSAFYMISKGTDLMSKIKLLKTAFLKVLQNVGIGSSPSKYQIQTAGKHCPICHGEYNSPILLQCRHIFCESCVTTWFDRKQTCPLCRAKIVDDPTWRDGSTSYFIQLF